MADAFASAAIACAEGLGIEDWLERNLDLSHVDGDDFVECFTLTGAAALAGRRRRKECAIILHTPQKWRQMALSWYYEPWRVGDPQLADGPRPADSVPEGAVAAAAELNPSLLRIVGYREAMVLGESRRSRCGIEWLPTQRDL